MCTHTSTTLGCSSLRGMGFFLSNTSGVCWDGVSGMTSRISLCSSYKQGKSTHLVHTPANNVLLCSVLKCETPCVAHLQGCWVICNRKMFSQEDSDWLEDVLVGRKLLIKRCASLYQIQTHVKHRQPATHRIQIRIKAGKLSMCKKTKRRTYTTRTNVC